MKIDIYSKKDIRYHNLILKWNSWFNNKLTINFHSADLDDCGEILNNFFNPYVKEITFRNYPLSRLPVNIINNTNLESIIIDNYLQPLYIINFSISSLKSIEIKANPNHQKYIISILGFKETDWLLARDDVIYHRI